MKVSGWRPYIRATISTKTAFHFYIFLAGYVLIAILGIFLLTGEFNIAYLAEDIEPLGGGVLYPLVFLYGFPAILGIFTGRVIIFIVSGLLEGFWAPAFPAFKSIFNAILLSIAYLFVKRIKLPHGRFFIGCWVITGSNLVFLMLLCASRTFPVWGFIEVWGLLISLIEINILGFLLLKSLSFYRFEVTKSTFAILGGSLAVISATLPWLANPPGYWFLWGFTFGGAVWISIARDPLLYVTLFLILLGGFLTLLSSKLVQNARKTTQIVGTFFRAFGIIAFVIFILSVLHVNLGMDLSEAFSLISYGFIVEITAQLVSLLSLDW